MAIMHVIQSINDLEKLYFSLQIRKCKRALNNRLDQKLEKIYQLHYESSCKWRASF